MSRPEPTFAEDSLKWRGRVLTGVFAHWCFDWDDLPVDETTPFEFDCCGCFSAELRAAYEYQAGPFEPAVWPKEMSL